MTEPTSRTLGLMDGVRSMPLFRQLVPMEAMIGWPIPIRRDSGWDARRAVYMKLPLFGTGRPVRRGDPTQLLPPFAVLTLNWANGVPVEYADLRYTQPWPMSPSQVAVGEFPHAAVRELSAGEYLKERTRLCELYDEVFESLAAGRPFTGRVEFGERLAVLMEPSLLPYYRLLAPRFVAAFLGDTGPDAPTPEEVTPR